MIRQASPQPTEKVFEAVKRVLDSGQYVKGPEVKTFEKNFSQISGCKYNIAVNSGTSALNIIMEAMDYPDNSEIIIPANCERKICLVQDEEIAMALPAEAAFYVADYLFSTGRKQGLKMPLRQVMPRLTEEVDPGYITAKEILDKSEK